MFDSLFYQQLCSEVSDSFDLYLSVTAGPVTGLLQFKTKPLVEKRNKEMQLKL